MALRKQKNKNLRTAKKYGDRKCYVIGITGPIGAGKSEVVNYIKANYRCRVFNTDEIAQEVSAPGGMSYDRLRELLPREAFDAATGYMDRPRVSELMYADPTLRQKMNDIIHPSVGIFLAAEIDKEKRHGLLDFCIIESALYDGGGFALLCKEVWNVTAPEEIRLQRLTDSRGYSKEKAKSIFESQLKYDKMRRKLGVQIINDAEPQKAFAQVDKEMNRLLPGCKREA